MGIAINTTELLEILKFTPPHHNIMLVGKHGIGKSRIITDYFEGEGRRVVTLFLGQMSDPGDIIGLPALDALSSKTDFRPPYWFPEAAADGRPAQPIVLFLDELNRARPEILQCVMDLTLNKTLAGKPLPSGSQIISAVNEGEEYQLTDLDPALVSRFNIYYFVPTVAEWLLWAGKNTIDGRIIAFIEKYPEHLESDVADDGGLNKGPDRRSWQRAGELIAGIEEITRTVEKALAGIIGAVAAIKFAAFLRERAGISARELLTDFDAHKKALEKLEVHELSTLNESSLRLIELETAEAQQKVYVENLEGFIKWLRTHKRNEVLAHWTTLFDGNGYPKAKLAILKYSPYIYKNMVDFIKEIKL
ncbi:AAA family ATPase [Breznakiellaceae bacterium SP9]